MKIASWNINSVRLRENLVRKLLKQESIDILCLQETKVKDELFPLERFKEDGYTNILFSGEKSYNGVCIISKTPLKLIEKRALYNEDKRHIAASFSTEDNTRINLHNFYIPAGGDIPDVDENPKFKHKLDYNKLMKEYLQKQYSKDDNLIILGDFNIAPYEQDVWSHKQLLKVVSHTPIEVEKLLETKDSLSFVDISREFVDEAEKLYSWWSYRNKDWKKSNRGRRLDHIWCTPALKKYIKNFYILKEARDWERTSDHVPVIIEI